MNRQKDNGFLYNFILVLILLLQIVTICAFGNMKTGFHEDEYYSYFSSNRTLGFYYPDREWVDTDTLRDEFVVKKGEGFNYPLVHQVQSWDVHPPLFYDLLHTACSLTPGIFSKWQGLCVNIIAYILSYVLLYFLAASIGMKKDLRLVTVTVYGFNPMTISCVMFIRMYMWMTVFVLASALIHMKLISLIKEHFMGLDMRPNQPSREKERSFFGQFMIYMGLLFVVDFLGFSTQYYYLIFMVMEGFFFCMWFLILIPMKRAPKEFIENAGYRTGVFARLKYVLLYIAGSIISLGAAILAYPASLSHIFRGYRGQEAQHAFTDIAGIPGRIGFFFSLLGKYLFSDLWGIIAVLTALSGVALFFFIKIKGEKDVLHIAHVRILVLSSFMYFIVVAMTALLLGDTSNRYEMPVYPLAILLTIYFVRVGVRAITGNRTFAGINIPVLVTFVIFALIDAKGVIADENVLFLYPEDAERITYAREMNGEGADVILMYNEQTPDNIWRLTDELLLYDRLYYADESDTEKIADDNLGDAPVLLVYAADHDGRDSLIEGIMEEYPSYTSCEVISVKDMWTLYEIR